MKIAIIGGGASGIAAALSAAEENPYAHITILERLDKIGKKILATGNGHCNMTNENMCADHYYSENTATAKKLLSEMPVEKVLSFFENIGLYTMTDDAGRIYPYCRQASMVLDILLLALKRKNINIVCGFKAEDIEFSKNKFAIKSQTGDIFRADKVIISAGGKAAPKQGTDGSGYRLAKKMGHTYTYIFPSLVAMECDSKVFKGFKGIRVMGGLSLFINGKKAGYDYGEIQLTDYGVSGIPAMQLSCLLKKHAIEKQAQIGIDFFPEKTVEELKKIITSRIKKYPDETLENLFLGLLHKNIMYAVLKQADTFPLSRKAQSLTPKETEKIISLLKMWKFNVKGTTGWDFAQVTGGGIPLDEIDENFQSKIIPNLYFTGEILDVTGQCGGYNLHWAWCSGMKAGKNAAKE